MPKYIRTEKGIYEVVEDSNKEWGKQIVVKFPKNLNMKLADVKDQIIKQSDTIEELCDCFVQIISNGTIKQRSIFSDLHHLKIRKENYEINRKVGERYETIIILH